MCKTNVEKLLLKKGTGSFEEMEMFFYRFIIVNEKDLFFFTVSTGTVLKYGTIVIFLNHVPVP